MSDPWMPCQEITIIISKLLIDSSHCVFSKWVSLSMLNMLKQGDIFQLSRLTSVNSVSTILGHCRVMFHWLHKHYTKPGSVEMSH